MRWLYHLIVRDQTHRYEPTSLEREGFIHASFKDAVAETARIHFPLAAPVLAMQIDPRRLEAKVLIADTPRGPMPHIHGPLTPDAIRAVIPIEQLDNAPDRVTGTRVAFVAFEGMTLLDLVGAYDPVSRIASMGFEPSLSAEIVGTAKQVWTGGGASIEVARVKPSLAEYDVLVVPGGFATRALETDEAFVAWLKTFPKNRLAAAVCTGSLLLGAVGRLEGKRATTHAAAMEGLARYGAKAVSERVVDEGQLVTAGGVTSALDLGLHLVRRLEGDETAAAIAKQMEFVAR